MKRLITIALLTAFLAVPALNADVRLKLDEPRVLPGTPTGFTISVANTDLAPLQLPAALWLVATRDGGESFLVSPYDLSDSAAVAIPQEQRTVPPGETRELRFDPSPVLVGSPWFTDGRLSEPGTYRLKAVFAPAVQANGDFTAAGALASNDETLHVAATTPEDVAVWEWMKRTSGGKWGQREWLSHPNAFSDHVLKNHPQSGYALYAAIFAGGDPAHRDALLAAQAARFPEKSYSEQLRLRLAWNQQIAADILRRSDVAAAANAAETARKIAAELAAGSRSANVRAEAQRLLRETPTREVLMQQTK